MAVPALLMLMTLTSSSELENVEEEYMRGIWFGLGAGEEF